ncbi:MAG: DUF131 domain-containing protein, partial [Candidatus Bathyarchaeia archaeon]
TSGRAAARSPIFPKARAAAFRTSQDRSFRRQAARAGVGGGSGVGPGPGGGFWGGGAILIGPIPIIFGTEGFPKALLLFALAIAAIFALTAILPFLWRG